MKLTIDKPALVSALAAANRAVERRNTIPILANVKLVALGGQLQVSATNLDQIVTVAKPARVAAEGGTTVPAHMFADLVKRLPDGAEITLESEETALAITSGRRRALLQALPVHDFPEFEAVTSPMGGLALPGAQLAAAIGRCEYAVSTEETRYYLNGIYLHPVHDGEDGHRAMMVATDGHRLKLTCVDDGEGPAPLDASAPGVIIPRGVLPLLAAAGEDAGAMVRLVWTDAKMTLEAGDLTITTKLIDGTFPDYMRVIPQDPEMNVTVPRAALASACEYVQAAQGDRTRAARLVFEGASLAISGASATGDSAEDVIELATPAAMALTIGMNSGYIIATLKALGGDDAIMGLSDPGLPVLFTSATRPHDRAVVMPMRV